MGFKAKARKHNPDGDKKDDSKDNKSKQGEQPCGIKGCEKFSDKSFGGRSLSIDNAIEMWVVETTQTEKVESVFARVATESGRKKISQMTHTDFTFSFH